MKTWGLLVVLVLWGRGLLAQNFVLLDKNDAYQTSVGQTLKIPLRIRNESDKGQFYIIRLTQQDLSSGQKGYFCLDKICLEPGITEFSKHIEAGATLDGLYYALETGLVTGQHALKFEVFVKGNSQLIVEKPVSVQIEEKPVKNFVFQSRDITIHDVYPNPVTTQAFIDYKIHNESVNAKVILHNILGLPIGEYELPFYESRVKLEAETLSPGVYFYTLYLDNDGVVTRKLIVRH